jgi:hypothetical protein
LWLGARMAESRCGIYTSNVVAMSEWEI